MFEALQQAAAKIPAPKQSTLQFGPWPGGLVLAKRAEQLQYYEASELLNFILVGKGYARTRNGLELSLSGHAGSIVQCDDATVDGTTLRFATDDNGYLYFGLDGALINIGALEGSSPRFCEFMGMLMLFDGSHIKMLSSVSYTTWATATAYTVDDLVVNDAMGYRCTAAHTSDAAKEPGTGGSWESYWEQNWVDICYDYGGDAADSRPYQYNNRQGDDDGSLALGNGTNDRICQRFTSQTWDSAYKMPPVVFYATLSKNGDGYTGSDDTPITARLRAVSGDAILASKTIVATAGAVAGTATEYSVTFSDDDITTKMSKATAMLLCLEYDNGDASHYIKVHCTTVASGGKAYRYASGNYATEVTKDLIAALKPGTPPKAVSGLVHANRLFAIEGLDGDSPSYLWYCAAGNHLDWSTDDGGGYAAAIDASATSFPIGGIASWYDDLWIFGAEDQPFLGKLSGSSPSEYAITRTLNKVCGDYKSIVPLPGHILYLHSGGVDAVSISYEGDSISIGTYSDAVWEAIKTNFSTDAFAGYDPVWGLYLLKLEDDDYVYAFHTKLKTTAAKGMSSKSVFPITRWQFALATNENPTCFGRGDGTLLVGTDAGKVYEMSASEVRDNDNEVTFKILSRYYSTRFGEMQAVKISPTIYGRFGGQFYLKTYRNYSRTYHQQSQVTLPLDDSATVDEFTMDVDEHLFLVDPAAYFDRSKWNFNFRSLMLGLESFQLSGAPIYLGDIYLLGNSIGGL